MKLSPKRADALQLRALAETLRSDADIAASMRVVFADALDRYVADEYPARAKNRPKQDERNMWLAVDYLIRLTEPKATKMAESLALSRACANHGIKISDSTIRKLLATHPRAARLAKELIDNAKVFRDPIAAALREAEGHWLRAEAVARGR